MSAGSAEDAVPLCPRCGRTPERAGAAAQRLATPEARAYAAPETVDEEADRQELAGWLARPEEPQVFSLFGWTAVLLIPFIDVPSLFDDTEEAPVDLDTAVGPGSTGLEEPLLKPDRAEPDTVGT